MTSKHIITALFTFLMLSGCSKDFLEKAPLDSINSENFFQTQEDAIYAINGAYQPLQWPKLYNMRMWTTDIFAGNSIVGAGGGDDGRETQELMNFVTATDNPGVLDLYRGPAPGILRANLVLEHVPQMDIDAALKDRILGEAYFLRGFYYFVLTRFFGDVPLILQPQVPGDDLRPHRTDIDVVYQQIITDFEEAYKLLPPREQYKARDLGRASKGAAAGMLAKVYLTLRQWDSALEYCEIVESMGYALHTDYRNNFNPGIKNGVESLFEVQYTVDPSHDFWSDENQSAWHSTFMGPRNSGMVAGGWGWNQPTQEFVDSYEADDKRKGATILYEGSPDFDGNAYSASYSTTGYNVRKFLVSKSIAPTYDSSPLNFPVLRFADVLLMKAESLNELNRSDDALNPLNKVRQRAGLAALSGISQTELRNSIMHERRIELAFEGHRWFDLARMNPVDAVTFLHSIGRTNATAAHLLLPIPQRERDANPNLTQNPGY